MINQLLIPNDLEQKIRRHLFQNELEQGAFLYAEVSWTENHLELRATDTYLVPPEGWDYQSEVYLQLKDTERANILRIARDTGLCLVECHSHPDSGDEVCFSPSDINGITEFASYVKWKLSSKPYVATVWGESSVDGVLWSDDFIQAKRLDQLCIMGTSTCTIIPRGTWFRKQRPYWRWSIGK